MKIKCISLWQPWASLVAHRMKKVETRHWRCPLPSGSLLAIHAAKKWDGELAGLCLTEPFKEALHAMGVRWARGGRDRLSLPTLPFGAVVCVVRLGECLPIVGEAKPTAGARCVGFDDEKILRVWHPFFLARQHGHSGDGHQQVAEHEAAFGDYSAGRFAWVFDDVLRLDEPAAEVGRQSFWDWEAPDGLRAAVARLNGRP